MTMCDDVCWACMTWYDEAACWCVVGYDDVRY